MTGQVVGAVLVGPLELRPMTVDDTEELWPLMSDPRLWDHEPAARHRDPARTRLYAARAHDKWADGLSYWTVRLRATGEVVGTGGAQRHEAGGADHWNLSYRVAVAHQGHGYAGLLLDAALAASAAAQPDRPCVAWIDAGNAASSAVARRAGLLDLGMRLNPADPARRHAWADRRLDESRYPVLAP